jgi:hypothetical protein
MGLTSGRDVMAAFKRQGGLFNISALNLNGDNCSVASLGALPSAQAEVPSISNITVKRAVTPFHTMAGRFRRRSATLRHLAFAES